MIPVKDLRDWSEGLLKSAHNKRGHRMTSLRFGRPQSASLLFIKKLPVRELSADISVVHLIYHHAYLIINRKLIGLQLQEKLV